MCVDFGIIMILVIMLIEIVIIYNLYTKQIDTLIGPTCSSVQFAQLTG